MRKNFCPVQCSCPGADCSGRMRSPLTGAVAVCSLPASPSLWFWVVCTTKADDIRSWKEKAHSTEIFSQSSSFLHLDLRAIKPYSCPVSSKEMGIFFFQTEQEKTFFFPWLQRQKLVSLFWSVLSEAWFYWREDSNNLVIILTCILPVVRYQMDQEAVG